MLAVLQECIEHAVRLSLLFPDFEIHSQPIFALRYNSHSLSQAAIYGAETRKNDCFCRKSVLPITI